MGLIVSIDIFILYFEIPLKLYIRNIDITSENQFNNPIGYIPPTNKDSFTCNLLKR